MPKINLGKVVGDKGEPFTFNDFTTEQLDGITPKILKGNVTTLDPDENAIVDIRKDGINNYIDFGIPRGKNGSELKDVSSENVVMADKTTLESTMTTVNENVSANSDEINKIKSPTFNDTVSTYSTLNDANTAAETTSNAIKSKVSIFTTLSNIKKSFSAIVQGLKILGTNVGAITGITSDLAGESETVAASIKAVNALNSKLANLKALHLLGTASAIGSFAIPNYRDYSFLLFCTNGGGWHDSRMLPAKLNPTFLVTASTDTVFKVVHHSGTVTVSFQTQGSAPFGKIEVYGVL